MRMRVGVVWYDAGMSGKENVIAEALKLSEADRVEVAEKLYESLDSTVEPDAEAAWGKEIQRRLKSIDTGEASFLTKEEAEKLIMGGDDGATPD